MLRSFKTVDTRASRLNFQTLPWVWRWPWGRYQKILIIHFLRVCVWQKYPKFMLKASKLWMLWPQNSIFQHLLLPEAYPEGDIKKSIMSIQRAIIKDSILNKIPEIHVKSFKTVDFTTPSLAWRWPWGWYQKLSVIFFQRAIMLNKIPKIHVKSFKTVDARASGLNYTTPSWAWRWPQGWYQKL